MLTWFITEDRDSFTVAKGESAPTFWTGINHQRLNFLLIGEHVAPGKYQHLLEKYSDLAFSGTLPVFFAILDPAHKYYKFNLEIINFFNYFQLEKNQERRRAMLNGIKLLENYIGHHKNVWQDMIRSIILENRDPQFMGHIRQNFKSALLRGHRSCAPKSLLIQPVELEQVAFPTNVLEVTRYPLTPDQQPHSNNFLWQRSPFKSVSQVTCRPKLETVGLELVVPYWMGKYYGFFQ